MCIALCDVCSERSRQQLSEAINTLSDVEDFEALEQIQEHENVKSVHTHITFPMSYATLAITLSTLHWTSSDVTDSANSLCMLHILYFAISCCLALITPKAAVVSKCYSLLFRGYRLNIVHRQGVLATRAPHTVSASSVVPCRQRQ